MEFSISDAMDNDVNLIINAISGASSQELQAIEHIANILHRYTKQAEKNQFFSQNKHKISKDKNTDTTKKEITINNESQKIHKKSQEGKPKPIKLPISPTSELNAIIAASKKIDAAANKAKITHVNNDDLLRAPKRDSNGRFIPKGATNSENTKKNNEEDKQTTLIGKLVSLTAAGVKNTANHLNESIQNSSSTEVVGATAGGSYFYAAKEIFDVASDGIGKINDIKNGVSSRVSNIKTKSQEVREKTKAAEEVKILKKRSKSDDKFHKELLDKLDDFQTKINSHRSSSILDLAGGLFGGIGKESKNRTRSRTIPSTEKVTSAKNALKNKSFSNPNGILSKMGGALNGAGVIAGLFSGYDKYAELKNNSNLSLSQKGAQIASTGIGAGSGAAVGALAGATALSFVPGVGTAVGGIVGGILGGIGGEKIGDVIGGEISDFIGSDSTLVDKAKDAADAFMNRITPIASFFGFSEPKSSSSTPVSDMPSSIPVKSFNTEDSIEKRIGAYNNYMDLAAKKYDVPSELIASVIRQESGGKSDAISPVGAQGLMQIMPSTAVDLGVKNTLDPKQNIDGGTKYLSQHIKRFKKRGYAESDAIQLSLASYNAGQGWIDSAIKATGNSKNAGDVLSALKNPALKRWSSTAGKYVTRSTSNIKQTDDYVKKIYGNYSYRKQLKNTSRIGNRVSSPESTLFIDPIAATAHLGGQVATAETTESISTNLKSQPMIERKENKIMSLNDKHKQSSNGEQHTTSSTANNHTEINMSHTRGIDIPTSFTNDYMRLVSLDIE
ncbi:TPA: lytic transglycosylase domain-containing protein [Photobacterium damselae]